jgi:hypothetical protein
VRYKIKLLLMFAPFVLFFAGLALLVNDMRHPLISNDQCIVTGTGSDAQKYRGRGVFLFRHSENIRHDVSLRCDRMGTVLLNDMQVFITPVKSGQGAQISRKQYHLLPDRWAVNVNTGHEAIPVKMPGR